MKLASDRKSYIILFSMSKGFYEQGDRVTVQSKAVERDITKRSILKLNSTKFVRYVACLALAILALGAFGNSVQAQWLNETFEQYTVSSPETQPTVGSSPFLQASSAATTVASTSGGKQVRYSKLTAAATGNSLQFSFSLNNASARSKGYYSFKVTQNSVPSPLVGSSDLNIRLGSNDSTTMGSANSAYVDIRFSPGASTCPFSVRSGATTQSVITSVSAATQHTVQVWYNNEATTMPYTDPSGNPQILAANSYVCYVNRLLANPTAQGSSMVTSVITNGSNLPSVTSASIGKISFNAASSKTVDFLIDDIYAADSAPVVSVPFAINSATTATVQAGSSFSYPITTSGGTATSFDATGLPSYLSINTATGVISGTVPASTPATTTPISIGLSATGASMVTANLALTVTAAPSDFVWNNTDTAWNSATSWTNNAVPANSASINTAAFGNLGGSPTSVNVGTGRSIGAIVFNSGAYAYTWTGTDITVGGLGSITNNSTATQTFGNKIINSSGNATWSSVSGGAMVFNGGIDLTQASSTANRILTFAGAGNVTVNGVIANGGTASAGVVTVTGTGATTLSGNNTYDGRTTMNAVGGTLTLSGDNSGASGGVTLTVGTLNINNNNALGTGPISFAAGTTINNTSASAVVNAENQAWTWSDSLTFGSSTNTSANNLDLGTGLVTVSSSRVITLAGTGAKLTMGAVNITSTSSGRQITANGAGNTLEMRGLTLSANTSNAVVVDLLGSANINVTGPIVNGTALAHGVDVAATGTTTFSGADTYTGTTEVKGNTLILAGTSTSSGYILDGTSTNSTVVLRVNATNALSSSATLLGSSSTGTAGTLQFATSGNYTLNRYLGQHMSFSNSSASNSTLTFTNTNSPNILGAITSGKTFVNRSTNLTITFNGEVDITGAENSTNTISTLGAVVISNRVFNSNTNFTRSLLKLETGNLTMHGVNSYNGTTIVSRGTLSIPTGGSLTACGDTIVRGTGTNTANSASLNLAGAARVVQVSTNGFVRGGGSITSLQVQDAGTVEVAVGTTWITGGTIDFATGSKVSVTGTPVAVTYTLMTASSVIDGIPSLETPISGYTLTKSSDGKSLILDQNDTTKPVIALIGASSVNVDFGSIYTDPGATVNDNKDASRPIDGTGSVNTSVPGSYTITFNTADAAGNVADTVTRTVVVGAAPVTDGYALYLSNNGVPAGTAFNAKVNGVTVGLAYAFGSSNGSPRNNGVTAVPVMSGNQLTYTFDVKDDPALTVTYQTSSDLVTWAAAQPISLGTGSSPSGFLKKQAQATGSGKLFIRINVTR